MLLPDERRDPGARATAGLRRVLRLQRGSSPGSGACPEARSPSRTTATTRSRSLDPASRPRHRVDIPAALTADILVNNAGVTHLKPRAETTLADFDSMVRVNLGVPFQLVQRLLPGLVAARASSACVAGSRVPMKVDRSAGRKSAAPVARSSATARWPRADPDTVRQHARRPPSLLLFRQLVPVDEPAPARSSHRPKRTVGAAGDIRRQDPATSRGARLGSFDRLPLGQGLRR
ncbi:SDR family NAD(P)-dependent oxidoreductase [Amycolatopsis sp. NPDC051758]|uniref:SDR family NAD(P)-dependent oxidoreductase n=1 Tax=Amycolatopsis sp. NPDC051758 TaxID=3363935 RepID=UPI00378DC080